MSTITKNTKVVYKRPKNKRAFKIHDIDLLNSVMQEAIGVQYNIERSPELQYLEIDAIFMHDLCAGFMALYTKLIEENLINTGNPHKPSLTLH